MVRVGREITERDDVRSARLLVVRRLAARHGGRPGKRRRVRVQLDLRRAARPRALVLDPRPRRRLARLRRPDAGLLHARPHQGDPAHAGRRLARHAGALGHTGRARLALPGDARHRGREDRRLHAAVPLLDRHHARQVGHAGRRPVRLQEPLRPRRLAARRVPRPGAHLWPALCRPHPAHARRRDARLHGRIGLAAQARASPTSRCPSRSCRPTSPTRTWCAARSR